MTSLNSFTVNIEACVIFSGVMRLREEEGPKTLGGIVSFLVSYNSGGVLRTNSTVGQNVHVAPF